MFGEVQSVKGQKNIITPNYNVSNSKFIDHILAFAIGFTSGFLIIYIFYKAIILSFVGGILIGIANIFLSMQRSIDKRKVKLRVQFFDFLESMLVSMRAGKPFVKAIESSRDDLALIYSDNSDIITEIDIILAKFNNSIPLSEAFMDLANRSKLEDIKSFASIYSTIEGKSSRVDEIVREIQQIISDKMVIEMEIDTMMTSAKIEVNIMLIMPLVILGLIGYSGAGFMDTIYTTFVGRVVATISFIIFIISYILAQKFSKIKL